MAQADEVDNSYLQVTFLHCKIIDSCTRHTTLVAVRYRLESVVKRFEHQDKALYKFRILLWGSLK